MYIKYGSRYFKATLSHEEVAENTTGTLPQMKILISKLLDSIT